MARGRPAGARQAVSLLPLAAPAPSVMALLTAIVLGLRHAADPDHLTAISTFVLSEEEGGARRAAWIGCWWGLGHATTVALLGLPVVLTGFQLPRLIGQGAEALVGLLIIVLAARLLQRWRQRTLHSHRHSHDGLAHVHLHAHARESVERVATDHRHGHSRLGRTPVAAYGIGLVHGIGGSAIIGLLLVSSMGSRGQAVAALLLFAGGTAASMAAMSGLLASVLARGPAFWRSGRAVPLFGSASLIFGCWYLATALRSIWSA